MYLRLVYMVTMSVVIRIAEICYNDKDNVELTIPLVLMLDTFEII